MTVKPVTTEIYLACGHATKVDFVLGDRRIRCRRCGEESVVHAKPVTTITYEVWSNLPYPSLFGEDTANGGT